MGDLGLIPGLRSSPGEGKDYPHQYSGLENSMDYSPWGHKQLDMTERISLPLIPPGIPKTTKDFCGLGRREKRQKVSGIKGALDLALSNINSRVYVCLRGEIDLQGVSEETCFLHAWKHPKTVSRDTPHAQTGNKEQLTPSPFHIP